MANAKKPTEAATGRYTPAPHALLDSIAFMGASHAARSLIYEVLRQHDGKNNGHLHLSANWLKGRGWNSKDGIQKAKTEAINRGLIIKTREGGLNAGPDRYAMTWLPISNYVGLDIAPRDYHPGAYQSLGPFVQSAARRGERTPPPPVVRTAPAHTPPRKCHPAHRGSAGPHTGAANEPTAPHTGAREANFAVSLPRTPETMNSYHCTGTAAVVAGKAADLPKPKHIAGKPRKRIVGKAGKSGKPKNSHATASETARPAQHVNPPAYASLRADCLGVGMSWATRVSPAIFGGAA